MPLLAQPLLAGNERILAGEFRVAAFLPAILFDELAHALRDRELFELGSGGGPV